MTSTDNKAKPRRFKKLRKRQKKFLDNTSNAADPQFENPTEEQQEAIDKLDRQTGFNPTSPEIPLVEAASEAIMEAFTFMTIQETGEVWYYDKGVYVPGGEILVAKEAEVMFGYKLTKGKLSEIIAHIMRRTYHKHEEIDADINIINLKNGLYDIDNDNLKKHTPKHLSINQKPITYSKGAKPHRFWKFLTEVLYPRDTRTAVAAIAYTFERDYTIEVLFKLYGLGANGKTVYTSLITALHGPDNVSNVPLSEMLSDKFALSDLENKDVNIDNELAGRTIKEAAVLKRLTGGSRQRIRIQRKNQRAYDTTLYAKLFFNANAMPDSQDTSDAYNRRLIIISFPNRFEGKTEDKQLISKLTTEDEISGIFNVLMAELRRIRKSKELYVNEKTIEEKRIKYERTINPLGSFRREAISEYSTPADYVTKVDFHNAYVAYCKEHALPYEKYDIFCKNVKNKTDIQETRKKSKEGDRIMCWAGVSLIPLYSSKTEQPLEEFI
jgi:putative DNA primase/helicase